MKMLVLVVKIVISSREGLPDEAREAYPLPLVGKTIDVEAEEFGKVTTGPGAR